ncbi:hypothetical protein OJAV_G00166300 [Oryzias javanicus]|uniref:Uncharacterized protein n=1 Tax=Oryzias javanicus TaxID=123683 RepID=A0A3S2P096_ORYJA|nr:hypothetical protein OJAV_G00166300 [Oryzias javanicus]
MDRRKRKYIFPDSAYEIPSRTRRSWKKRNLTEAIKKRSEQTWEKSCMHLAARQTPLGVIDANPVQSSPLEEEIVALRRENTRLQEHLRASSSSVEELRVQVSTLKKEYSRLCKMTCEEIPSLVGAVKTLISERDSGQHEATPSKSGSVRNDVTAVSGRSVVTTVRPRTPDVPLGADGSMLSFSTTQGQTWLT